MHAETFHNIYYATMGRGCLFVLEGGAPGKWGVLTLYSYPSHNFKASRKFFLLHNSFFFFRARYVLYDASMSSNYDPVKHLEHPLTLKQITVLEEYAKHPDLHLACVKAGYKNPDNAARQIRKSEAFAREFDKLNEVMRKSIRMTAEHAGARLLDLMDKFERDYDEAEGKDRGQLASTLGKMADTYLKAAGAYQQEQVDTSGITINIDLSAGGEVEVDDTGKKANVRTGGKAKDNEL